MSVCDGKELVLSVLNEISERKKIQTPMSLKSWSLHSSSINLGRKKGRGIINRCQDQHATSKNK